MSETDGESAERWQRLEHWFQRALACAPDERGRVLDDLPDDEPGLREELRRLLANHAALSGGGSQSAFLEALDAGSAAALLETPAVEEVGAGEAIGPYRVIRRLGEGGMGVVYLAEDPRLERKVALKLLPPWLSSNSTARERLVLEAKAASALDHANIATIHEINAADDGRLYIVMAYYEGETLEARITRGPMVRDEAIGIARQIAGGLAAAHDRGIVHRDIKPANVMITPDGVAKILDFGIAKIGTDGPTRTGTTLGTVAYMSPEQAMAEPVDARSDIWSLGVLLHQMLAGALPFGAEAPGALLYQICHEDPAPLEQLRPDVDPDLAGLVERCLMKDPDQRPASGREIIAALAVPDRTQPGRAAPSAPSAPTRAGRGWMAMVAVALCVVAAGAYALWPRDSATDANGLAVEQSVAVLPFVNLSGTEEAEPYAQGVHDDLLTRLSNIADFRVIARRAVEPYRGSDIPTQEIAEALGVRWVLEGGVATIDNRILVNARLIDPATETQVWAERYERDLTVQNLFALQREITIEISRSLEARLTPLDQERLAVQPTDDLEAYRLYVEGRLLLEQRSEQGLRRGETLFRQAVAQDTAFAAAWAGLADALGLLVNYGFASRDSVRAAVFDAAERAVALDPNLAEAQTSRGFAYHVLQYDGPAARRAYERAIALNPSHAQTHQWLGNLLLSLGDLPAAGPLLRRAAVLDPTSPSIRAALAQWYLFADSMEASLEQAQLAVDLSPSFASAAMLLGEALRALGRPEEAQEALERAFELPGTNIRGMPGLWVEMALVYRTLGDSVRLQAVAEQLEQMPPSVLAGFRAGSGETEEALALLTNSRPVPEQSTIFRYHPVFSSVRADPRFQALLARFDRAWGLVPDSTAPGPS